MAEQYNSLSFSDYPPIELLGSNVYENSIKRLSFQYRTKIEDKLIAYIAVSQDNPNILNFRLICSDNASCKANYL